MLLFKGNGRNVHVQTKGVYVWYVIYFTSLLYHEIIDTATFHIKCNMIVTLQVQRFAIFEISRQKTPHTLLNH